VQVLHVAAGDQAQAMAAVDELLRLSRLVPDFRWDRAAVISRDWRSLNPVRAYAEAQGIPVDMANEDLPSLWRLRKVQAFIARIREEKGLIGIPHLLDVLNGMTQNRWTGVIAEGIAALARDLNDKAAPGADLVEWFAEWGRNVRGFLLLTAHRAKGLEFEDVVILDGNWAGLSRGEDVAAPRRLFYVAMTRARRSLALIATGQHPFLPASALRRKVTPEPRLAPPLITWAMPDMKAVDLSWVGRQWNGHDCHKALAEAQIGAPLTLHPKAERWLILDTKGRQIGVMRKVWSPPPGQAILSATLGAVVNWRAVDNEDAFRPHLKHETWEVALPEICFGLGMV